MFTVCWTQSLEGKCTMDFPTRASAMDFMACLNDTCNPYLEYE